MTLMTPPWGIKTNLTAYWTLDEPPGLSRNELHDAAGALALTEVNSPDETTGKKGRCADLAAASSMALTHSDTATLDMGDIDFTIVAWVMLSSTASTRTVVSKYFSTGNQRGYSLDYNSTASRFRFVMSSDGTSGTIVNCDASTFGAPSTSTWYMLLAQYKDRKSVV